ncbi:hypothetical protein ABPG75_004556 [Micractinium tetrahymenae]
MPAAATPAVGTFPKPAIASTTLTSSYTNYLIANGDWVQDTGYPASTGACDAVNNATWTYTWVWFSGASPPGTATVKVGQSGFSGVLDIWSGSEPAPTINVSCVAQYAFGGSTGDKSLDVTPLTYYFFKVTDNNEKNQLALALKGPPPLGSFPNPAPITSLPFNGSIVAADYVTDDLGSMPPLNPLCMMVSFMPFPTYTWAWFSGPSPPATVQVSVTQQSANGGVDIWSSAVAPPSTVAQCLVEYQFSGSSGIKEFSPIANTYYLFKIYDNLAKVQTTLQLRPPPPLGSFPNPANITSLPYSGVIGAPDYVSDYSSDVPSPVAPCSTVQALNDTYTWLWFSGPSPPSPVKVKLGQSGTNGILDIWSSTSAPPTTDAACVNSYTFQGSTGDQYLTPDPNTYYFFKASDKGSKLLLALTLDPPPPIGTFANPANISSLPYTGSIDMRSGTADYITDDINTVPLTAMPPCTIVNTMPNT